ncbi:MAG: RluA family pseudouridine synthase [Syntrophomonadaceae bacterium]|jgi:23S rRNA pseudouridine1911/1915/1917 synthase|nr:RluA family pseudouridine synthase [Syntrophomonadaceae bacterium]
MKPDNNSLVYVVDPKDNYVYLREVLTNRWQLSRSLQVRLKAQNKIKVNGQVTRTNYRLQPGDIVTVGIDLEETSDITPLYAPLDIIYEDPDCLVVNKPPGMAVHSPRGGPEITLANAVTYYWVRQGKTLLFRPVNRLDKDTSGLVLIGKSQFAHQAMYRQQKAGTITRRYLAVVEGIVVPDRGSIDLPIAHLDPDLRSRTVHPTGKRAVTHFNVIERFNGFTLLSLTLGTGRTHQIRVHLSHLGHPIHGDTLYGHPSPYISRQALHAGELCFHQPRSGEPIHLTVPLPDDMAELVENLKAGN